MALLPPSAVPGTDSAAQTGNSPARTRPSHTGPTATPTTVVVVELVDAVAKTAAAAVAVTAPAVVADVTEFAAGADAAVIVVVVVGSGLAADSAVASSEADLVVGKVDFAMLLQAVRGVTKAIEVGVRAERYSFELVGGFAVLHYFRRSKSLRFRHPIHLKVELGMDKQRIVNYNAGLRLDVVILVTQIDGKAC